MTRKSNHKKDLEKIAQNPSKFGFNHIVCVSVEPTLYVNGNGGRIIAQPDLVMESSKKEVHIVEYKSNGDQRLMERAQKQIENALWWFGRYRQDILPEKIHTHIISGSDPKYKGLLK